MRFFILFCVSLVSVYASGQTYIVYHVKGKVLALSGKEQVQVNIGDRLSKGQSIVIKKDSQISFLNEKGLAVIFVSPGKYLYENIHDAVNKSQDVASPYLAYVWKKLFEHHGHDVASLGNAPKAGISRSTWRVTSPIDSAIVISPEIKFSWKPASEATYFTITDRNKTKIVKLAIQDSTLTVFANEMPLKKGEWFSWSLSDSRLESNFIQVFYLPGKEWIETFRTQEAAMKELLSDLGDKNFQESEMKKFYESKKVVR